MLRRGLRVQRVQGLRGIGVSASARDHTMLRDADLGPKNTKVWPISSRKQLYRQTPLALELGRFLT